MFKNVPTALLLALSLTGIGTGTLAATTRAASSTGSSNTKAKCPFLAEDATTPVSYELPLDAFTGQTGGLSLEFRGVEPYVTRKTLPYGSRPKVTVTRYSSQDPPAISFDEQEHRVVITDPECEGYSTSNNGGSGDGDNQNGASSGACTSFYSSYNVNADSNKSHKYWMAAASVVAAGWTQSPAIAAGVVLAGLMPGVAAHNQDTCSSSVQVVVEAPASYEGVVDICWRELNDTAICPDPFPTFETCDDPAPECAVAVVGGGAGGLYTALRLVDEGLIDASDVCVFEMTERVGGRLFSLRGLGPDNDLTVDAGGYRTWPQFTPTLHALITDYLNITMDCYDDTDPCEVYNIVTPQGKKGGFAKFVETMMQKLVDGGACFYPHHELTSIRKVQLNDTTASGTTASTRLLPSQDDVITELKFANGVTAHATATTILNMPQRPLLTVLRNSNLDEEGIIDMETLDALHSVQTVMATKFYLYYPRGSVWWKQLGIGSGDFVSPGDARTMLLAGRYHDGQVECDDDEDPDTCHGFLLATYANDLSGNKQQFFRRFQRNRPEPVTFVENSDMEGRYLLQHAHQRLKDYHLYENTANVSYTGFEANQVFSKASPPTFGILATWNGAIPWSGGAWHAWTDTSNIDLAKQPLVDDNVFVVNEAYSLLQGWAEGSIKLADEILEDHFGVERPWDFEVVDVNQLVRQTNSEECVEGAPESGGGGGGSSNEEAASGSSGGGGVDATAAILCFAKDALVEMANGSLKPIQDLQEGDIVYTGTGKGAGVVTKALKHSVGKAVPVATFLTELGPLVGTPDHPVLHMGEWVEFQQLLVDKSGTGSDLESVSNQFVDIFYNLEIDAEDVEESTHSYVVNGVVASGLGDNEMLNTRFARQKTW